MYKRNQAKGSEAINVSSGMIVLWSRFISGVKFMVWLTLGFSGTVLR